MNNEVRVRGLERKENDVSRGETLANALLEYYTYLRVRYFCLGTRASIDNTRHFFQPPITTRMTSSVVAKHIV